MNTKDIHLQSLTVSDKMEIIKIKVETAILVENIAKKN
jgi:hypothetical protein